MEYDLKGNCAEACESDMFWSNQVKEATVINASTKVLGSKSSKKLTHEGERANERTGTSAPEDELPVSCDERDNY